MVAKGTSEEDIFRHALQFGGLDEQRDYVRRACGEDVVLCAAVEALLRQHHASSILDAPALESLFPYETTSLTEGPGAIIGRYKLLEKIGEGGMAVVYMAEQEQPLRRKVALKIIKLGMDTRQVIVRFEAERQALALMDHPCIAKVLDAGTTETGRPYFVMELVQGVSITDYCDKNSLSTKDRLALFIQVCNAVQHAHQKGIIHRDIKPSNVMVTHHDGKPIPKVIDFGIAKATNQKLTEKTLFTRYAHIIGTPAYMSPEQAELSDLDIDTRSDIYSLGVLLYELLTGTTPFSEEELRKAGYLEMQRIIREQEPAKPSTKLTTLGETLTDIAKHRGCTPDLLRKAVRGDLDWIVMKSLEKDRTHRYEGANALAEDIRRHLEHEPVVARSPGTTYRLRKFLRRHRVQVLASLTMAAIAVAAVVVLSLWNRDRLQAEALRHKEILSQAREQYAKADRDAALETIRPIFDSKHVGPEARLLQATILVDNHRSEEAVNVLNRLLDERAEIAGAAHSLLARILWESESPNAEKLKEIEEHRRQAEALRPDTAEAYFLRAMTAVTVKEQLVALDKALQLDPDHYESLRLRAFTYYASRKYTNMRDDALGMTYLRRRDPLGYSLRAVALRELGEYGQAIAEYDKAMERTSKEDPHYLDLAGQRCEALLRKGDYERVLVEAQECSKLWPEKAVFRHHLFCALTAVGDYEKAEALFRQIISPGQQARVQFRDWCTKYVFDALARERSWHPPDSEPAGAAFLPMVEAEEIHRELSTKGRRVTTDGFSAQWSPDGKKLAFSVGVIGNSGVALYDPATRETELLIVPGKYPKWSPDGRYIAFVRDRQFLRVPEFVAADPQNQRPPGTDEEVWLMKSDGAEPRRLARGVWPSWGRDSTFVYYRSRVDRTLYSISIMGENAEPKRIMPCPGYNPSVSPDNQHVAYMQGRSLKVTNLPSQTVVAEWPLPLPSDGWGASAWSPDGNELCLGGSGGVENRTGLWVYRLDQNEPVRILGGSITVGSWAPDGTKLVFELGVPHSEIWTVDLALGVSVIEALGPARTAERHLRELVASQTRRIEADPWDAYAYSDRARYYDYLHDRERADADIRRWSAVVSGRLPHVDRPARADFTFGEPVDLDVARLFFPNSNIFVTSFSSDNREMFVYSDLGGGQGGSDIWVLKRAAPEEAWGPPENLGPTVNSADGDGFASITGDGLELYFGSLRPGGYGNWDIYVATRATRTSPWASATNLGSKLNSSYVDGGVSVSSDGLELYFTSTRPPGYGASDLYVSKRATPQDPWGDPMNLGPVVNSAYYEDSPNLSPDGLLLLFESNRPGGYGKTDLWMTRRASHTAPWELVVNLGPTINSSEIDCQACLAPDGSALYFAWNWFDRPDPDRPWKAQIIPIGAPGDEMVKGERDQK